MSYGLTQGLFLRRLDSCQSLCSISLLILCLFTSIYEVIISLVVNYSFLPLILESSTQCYMRLLGAYMFITRKSPYLRPPFICLYHKWDVLLFSWQCSSVTFFIHYKPLFFLFSLFLCFYPSFTVYVWMCSSKFILLAIFWVSWICNVPCQT